MMKSPKGHTNYGNRPAGRLDRGAGLARAGKGRFGISAVSLDSDPNTLTSLELGRERKNRFRNEARHRNQPSYRCQRI